MWSPISVIFLVTIVTTLGINGILCIECSAGYFGDDCSGICHCNQTEEVCDKRTGHCSSGCAAGWSGDICQTKVDEESVFNVSVLGVAVGVVVFSLLVIVIAGGCCLTRIRKVRSHHRRAQEDAQIEQQNRLQNFFHNYNNPIHSGHRNPFRVIPFRQKLESRFIQADGRRNSAPPQYTGPFIAAIKHDDILPPRSETPPPTYEESVASRIQDHVTACRRQSQEMLLSRSRSSSVFAIS